MTGPLLELYPFRRTLLDIPRHRMNAARHRIELKARFTAWQRWSMAEASINVRN
jgi:hypothetical protein